MEAALTKTYSVYEARAHFSDLLRKVRAGQRVTISIRGEEVAEIRPIAKKQESFQDRIRNLEERGLLTPPAAPKSRIPMLVKRRGALARFLAERE